VVEHVFQSTFGMEAEVQTMAVVAQERIVDFARRVLDPTYFSDFVLLLQMREHRDPEVRQQADEKLLPFIDMLRSELNRCG
jgi:hypothetical protein